MMTLVFITHLGGVLTILSPCIFLILPSVFSRTRQSFIRNTLPMRVRTAVTCTLVATLAAVGGFWAICAGEYGRAAAFLRFAIFGTSLLLQLIARIITRSVSDFRSWFLRAPGESDSTPTMTSLLMIGIGLVCFKHFALGFYLVSS